MSVNLSDQIYYVPMDGETEITGKKILAKIQAFTDNSDVGTVTSKIETLQTQVTANTKNITNISKNLDKSTTIANLKSDVETVKSDVETVKSDVNAIDGTISNLNNTYLPLDGGGTLYLMDGPTAFVYTLGTGCTVTKTSYSTLSNYNSYLAVKFTSQDGYIAFPGPIKPTGTTSDGAVSYGFEYGTAENADRANVKVYFFDDNQWKWYKTSASTSSSCSSDLATSGTYVVSLDDDQPYHTDEDEKPSLPTLAAGTIDTIYFSANTEVSVENPCSYKIYQRGVAAQYVTATKGTIAEITPKTWATKVDLESAQSITGSKKFKYTTEAIDNHLDVGYNTAYVSGAKGDFISEPLSVNSGIPTIIVYDGSSTEAWTKQVVIASVGTVITFNSSNWKWIGGTEPEVPSQGLLICKWCGSFGLATIISGDE